MLFSTLHSKITGLLPQYGMGPLSQKTLWVVAARVIQFLGLFLGLAVLARRLDREVFGVFQQGLLLVSTLTTILLLGLPQGINYLLPRANVEQGRQVIWLTLALVATFALPIGLLFVLFPQLAALLVGKSEISSLMGGVIFLLLSNLIANFLEPLAIIKGRQRLLLTVMTVYWVLFAAMTIGIGLTGNLGTLFLALGGLALGRTLVTLLFIQTQWGLWDLRMDPSIMRQLTRLALVLGPIAIVDVLAAQIDKFVVSHWFGPATFAVYSLGSIELPFVPLVVGAVTATLMPELTRLLHEKQEAHALKIVNRSVEKLAWVLLPVFFYSLFYAETLIPLVLSEKYRPSVPIFLVFLCLVPLRVLNLHPLFIAAGLQKYLLRGRILDASLNFLGSLALVATALGMYGPAVAAVAATFVHKLYQTWVAQRNLCVPLSAIYPWKGLARVALWSLSGAAGSWFIAFRIPMGDVLSLLLGSMLFTAWSLYWLAREAQAK